jgi:hypothetical protein
VTDSQKVLLIAPKAKAAGYFLQASWALPDPLSKKSYYIVWQRFSKENKAWHALSGPNQSLTFETIAAKDIKKNYNVYLWPKHKKELHKAPVKFTPSGLLSNAAMAWGEVKTGKRAPEAPERFKLA